MNITKTVMKPPAVSRISRTFGILGIILPAPLALNAQFVAAPSGPFPAGSSPVSVVVANFDQNPIPDLAVADAVGKTITVLLGTGLGAFKPGVSFPLTASPNAMAVGDFNRDGIPDLAIANTNENTVTILLGDGSGSFKPGPNSPIAVPGSPDAVAVGDFNGDGFLDLAIASRAGNSVTVLLGDPNGAFKTETGSPFPVGTSPSSVAVGDFNGDNMPDLAVTNELDDTVTVLLNQGASGFTPAPGSPFIVGTNPASVVAGDFNGDGVLDVAIANLTTNNVTILLGFGNGGFTPVGASIPVGTKPFSMALADFNQDGFPDLAVANSGGNKVTVLLGNGMGGFTAAIGSPFLTESSPLSVAVGDFNGDGKPDFVTANNGADDVTVWLNTFSTVPTMVSAASYKPSVAPGAIVSIFGTGLGAVAMPATALPLPGRLEGTSVSITDASGAKSSAIPLYYVGPAQINAVIPSTVAVGKAVFTVSTSSGVPQTNSIMIAPVAPALFSANASGEGVAAALVVDGSGAPALVFSCPGPPAAGPCVPVPVDVSDGASVLMLYGTGIRNRVQLPDVTVAVGAQTLPALFAGPTSYAGEDQVNVSLPSSLAGSGTVYISVSIAGSTASPMMSNQVTLQIQ
jgi:uncharacterized protein (TIGR03437 family)